jgi:hypothetical protein
VSAVLLECHPKGSTISFLYGDCTPQDGGCALPLEIQNYSPQMRNREMYTRVRGPFGGPPGSPAPPPPAIVVRGHDMMIDEAPATDYGGHLDVYRADTTVAVFSEGGSRIEVAEDLVEAPAIPATLARHGLYFDRACIDIAGYCSADRSLTSEETERLLGILVFYGAAYGMPFLAGLMFGRVWTLILPMLLWFVYSIGGSVGWVATGENWLIFIPFLIAGGVIAALVGTWIHAALFGRRRRPST